MILNILIFKKGPSKVIWCFQFVNVLKNVRAVLASPEPLNFSRDLEKSEDSSLNSNQSSSASRELITSISLLYIFIDVTFADEDGY